MAPGSLSHLINFTPSQGPYSLYNSAVLTFAIRLTQKLFTPWVKSPGTRSFVQIPVPQVTLDAATVSGITRNTVDSFYGIPYAKTPIGSLRFAHPEAIEEYQHDFVAVKQPLACPQQRSHWPGRRVTESAKYTEGEDCLKINIQRPTGTRPDARLPVLVFLHGGGFEAGSATDGMQMIRRGVELQSPFLYVSFNYRVSSFGFLGGREMLAAGASNLGIRDQRLALLWVQQFIEHFGGDPTKVTTWGESAGAISLGVHLVINDGTNDGLFRAAVFTSGAPLMLATMQAAQSGYDSFVRKAKCSTSPDTFQCVKNSSYTQLKGAMDESPTVMGYRGLKAPFMPRIDGELIKDSPQTLLSKNRYSGIPIICGGNDDEGTLFSMASKNITTDTHFRKWVKDVWAPHGDEKDLDELMQMYPNDVKRGSPFNTGRANAMTPQYKRIAALQGDIVFQAPRRNLLRVNTQLAPSYAYLNKRAKWLSVIGSSHKLRPPPELVDHIIHFIRTGDNPNGPNLPHWPVYGAAKNVLTFFDGQPNSTITSDTFREPQLNFILRFTKRNPL